MSTQFGAKARPIIPHKRGDNFVARCQYTRDDGTPLDITDVTIASQVRASDGTLVQALSVTKDPDQTGDGRGRFAVRASFEQTSAWPIGPLGWDIEYTQGGERTSTDTMMVQVVADITQT